MLNEKDSRYFGVLYLDEIPKFGSRVLEVLRQPLEDKQATPTQMGKKGTNLQEKARPLDPVLVW